MNYAIRISYSYEQLKPVFVKLQECTDRLVVYEHQANRVHVHGLLINCKVSTDTLKNYVKRTLGTESVPKSDWSFKTLFEGNPVDDNFIIYMSKGDLQPAHVHNYELECLEQYRLKWENRSDYVKKKTRDMVQYKLKIENPREAKIRINVMMDMVKQRVKENGLKRPRDVLEVIRQVVYIECKTVVGRYKIRDFYDYVMADADKDTWLANMEKLISYE